MRTLARNAPAAAPLAAAGAGCVRWGADRVRDRVDGLEGVEAVDGVRVISFPPCSPTTMEHGERLHAFGRAQEIRAPQGIRRGQTELLLRGEAPGADPLADEISHLAQLQVDQQRAPAPDQAARR